MDIEIQSDAFYSVTTRWDNVSLIVTDVTRTYTVGWAGKVKLVGVDEELYTKQFFLIRFVDYFYCKSEQHFTIYSCQFVFNDLLMIT